MRLIYFTKHQHSFAWTISDQHTHDRLAETYRVAGRYYIVGVYKNDKLEMVYDNTGVRQFENLEEVHDYAEFIGEPE